MKNTQILLILAALYLIFKSAAKNAEQNDSAAKIAVPGTLAADLQQATKLLQDRVNSFESRLAALEASPFE